jgi:hypothetical protein
VPTSVEAFSDWIPAFAGMTGLHSGQSDKSLGNGYNLWVPLLACPAVPPKKSFVAGMAMKGTESLEAFYSDSRKFSRNKIALLDKPAVAPSIESVIIFENYYSYPI